MQPTETQIFWNEDWDLVHQTLPARCSMCVNDLFQLYAVAVHTIPDRFPSGGGGGYFLVIGAYGYVPLDGVA